MPSAWWSRCAVRRWQAGVGLVADGVVGPYCLQLLDVRPAPSFEPLCDYAATLDAVAQVYPADQLMTLFYEDMHRDREAALGHVCRFIGMSFDARRLPELGRRFNRSQDVALPDGMRAHLRERLAGQARCVRARVGRLPQAWEHEFNGPL